MVNCILLFVVISKVLSSIIVDEVWKYSKNEYSDCSGQGTLDDNGFCKCYPNFFGDECSITDCNGFLSNGTETCSGNGLCVDHNFCICLSGYNGRYCDLTSCFGVNSTNTSFICGGNGECKNINTCTCKSGFYGSECQFTNTSSTQVATISTNNECPNNTLDLIHQMAVDFSTCHSGEEFDNRIMCSPGHSDYEIENYESESSCEAYNFIEFVPSSFISCQMMETKPSGKLFYTQFCGDFISSFDEDQLLHNGFIVQDHVDSPDCADPPAVKQYYKYGACVVMEDKNVRMKCLDNGNRIYSEVYDDRNCSIYNRVEFFTDVSETSCQNNQSYQTSASGCFTDCFGNYSWNPETVCSNRGICIDLNNCSCETGFFGPICEDWTCWNVTYNDTNACSGHGACTDYNLCECITGFHGKNCEKHFWDKLTGSYVATQPPVYGCLESSTTPGSRYDGGQFYVDGINRFWMFGGQDSVGSYNDVWYFSFGKWCFAKGGEEGVVGSPGLPPSEPGQYNASVLPPSSHGHNVFGTKNLVSFFTFGGDQSPDGVDMDTNELWEFNYIFREWRLIRRKEEDYENAEVPGPRRHACVVVHQNWTGSVAYIFGGMDRSRMGGAYNDMWSYDIMGDVFTHLGGSYYNNSQKNVSFLGDSNITSVPQPRSGSSCWMSKDHIYVFGGMHVYDHQYGVNNDMWVFNTSLNQWNYLYGNRSIQNRNMIGNIYGYGNDSVNVPGGRKYMSFWKLSFDLFCIFGGASMENNMFGDIWVFDISTNLFKFENGTELVNVIPTQHTMGSRVHSFSGIDESKRVKIFGGGTFEEK